MANYTPYGLTTQDRAGLGGKRNFGCLIDYTDLSGTAATTLVLTLQAYAARDLLSDFCFDLIDPFVGASITNLKLDVGYDGTTVDLQTGFINQQELVASGYRRCDNGSVAAVNTSTVDNTYGQAENDVITSLRTLANDANSRKLAAQEAGNITALFTATGANLSALTAGRLRLYFGQFGLTKLRDMNGR